MTISVISSIACFLAMFCYLYAILLILEWAIHIFPGALLNGVRRVLFRLSYLFLAWSDRSFAVDFGSFRSRGLLMAVMLIVIGRYGIPWIVLASFYLRN